jgi:hypothetical protein
MKNQQLVEAYNNLVESGKAMVLLMAPDAGLSATEVAAVYDAYAKLVEARKMMLPVVEGKL